jgi:ABC-2 type transport system ATP-binding protein
MHGNIAIQIVGLSKRYKNADSLAVESLNLDISDGEIFGLLGPNGAGKTTTLSILCSLLQPSSGDIWIKGINLKNSVNKIKQLIGVVPQEIALYPELTGTENLKFFGNMYGLSGSFLSDKITMMLKEFGLEKKADKRVITFSGGMKRRLNLIAGILHSPEILFLDEPTVGVDVQSRQVIIDFLFEINKKGTTIIYTSHHMEEAEKLCTDVAIIDQGKIITRGKPNELICAYNNCNNLEDIFLEITGRSLRD